MSSIVAAVTFITHVYETLFLVKEWQSDRARGERLQQENLEAELLALKSEVNPHTLFNNLNALSHLVEHGHPHAAAFVGALATSYRYLLKTGSKRLVPLADEAGRIVPVGRGGERRAIALANPSLGGRPFATPTLWAAIQYLMPGEDAPEHRHTRVLDAEFQRFRRG